jgi:hypothetical protein
MSPWDENLRRSNQEWAIQRLMQNWAHDTERRQTKQKL